MWPLCIYALFCRTRLDRFPTWRGSGNLTRTRRHIYVLLLRNCTDDFDAGDDNVCGDPVDEDRCVEMMVVVMVVIIVMMMMMILMMVLICWCDDEDRSRCAAGVEDESQTFNQAKPRAPQSYSLTVYTFTEGPKVLQCTVILGAPKSYPMHKTQSSRTAHLHNDHCKCTLCTLFTTMI